MTSCLGAVLINSHGGADGNLGNDDDREDGNDGGFLSISSGLPGILHDMSHENTKAHKESNPLSVQIFKSNLLGRDLHNHPTSRSDLNLGDGLRHGLLSLSLDVLALGAHRNDTAGT